MSKVAALICQKPKTNITSLFINKVYIGTQIMSKSVKHETTENKGSII